MATLSVVAFTGRGTARSAAPRLDGSLVHVPTPPGCGGERGASLWLHTTGVLPPGPGGELHRGTSVGPRGLRPHQPPTQARCSLSGLLVEGERAGAQTAGASPACLNPTPRASITEMPGRGHREQRTRPDAVMLCRCRIEWQRQLAAESGGATVNSHDDGSERILEQSSLGSAAARKLRRRTPRDRVIDVQRN